MVFKIVYWRSFIACSHLVTAPSQKDLAFKIIHELVCYFNKYKKDTFL